MGLVARNTETTTSFGRLIVHDRAERHARSAWITRLAAL
jgi:hypothetical protein